MIRYLFILIQQLPLYLLVCWFHSKAREDVEVEEEDFTQSCS